MNGQWLMLSSLLLTRSWHYCSEMADKKLLYFCHNFSLFIINPSVKRLHFFKIWKKLKKKKEISALVRVCLLSTYLQIRFCHQILISFLNIKIKYHVPRILHKTIFINILRKYSWLIWNRHCVKIIQIRSFFWSVFSRIRTEYRKIWIRKNSLYGYFPHSEELPKLLF